MKILLDSHSTVTQNKSGGLQVRIFEHFKNLEHEGVACKLFNKWTDKIEDYDVYHLFKVTKDSYNEVLFAKQKGKKIVVSAVIPISGANNIKISLILASFFKLALPYEFIRKILDISDLITTETEEEKKFIVSNYKIQKDKIIVIPNGVSDRFLNNNSLGVSFKEVYNIKTPFVLQVGRVEKNKNQLRVIKALKNLNIPMVFVGGAFLNEVDYYRECKDELGDNMIMTDWIEHDSELILSAYREAKVLVLPSLFETFGNVLVEAGVSGTNIACSETLAINEYPISKHWSKFDPTNLKSIRDAVFEEYNKPYDHNIREEFVSTFSWGTIIKQYIDVYRKVLSN